MTTFREQFFQKCGGIDLGQTPLSEKDVETLTAIYPETVKKFKAMVKALPDFDGLDYASHDEGLMLGSRVHNLEAIKYRLRGKPFAESPEGWLMDALFDSASADYWYQFEKEW